MVDCSSLGFGGCLGQRLFPASLFIEVVHICLKQMLVSQFAYLLEAFNLILNLLIFMFFRFIYFILHICMFCLHVYLCTVYVPGGNQGI